MTPFIGVRISWLMVARKADLARSAANAVSRAASSSLSASLYAVMLRAVPRISSGRPVLVAQHLAGRAYPDHLLTGSAADPLIELEAG